MPHVLVVDDTAVDRTLASGLLTQSPQLTVDYAEHGAAALELLQKDTFDLVVTDLQMPEVDGLELVNTIRMVAPEVPVILMTAQGSEAIAIAALEQGAAGYVPKSHLAELLLPTAEQVLAMSHAEHTSTRLMQCQGSWQAKFELDNDPDLIDALVDHVQHTLQGMEFVDHTEKLRIGVALREALRNAMLHGNLELANEDMDGPWVVDAMKQRTESSPYQERRVSVSVDVEQDRAEFVIADEGPGFDTDAFSSRDLSSPESLQGDSGRGIVLMQSFMDEVAYNERGNQVTMVKNRTRRREG